VDSTKKIKYLEENVGTATVVLTDAEITQLRELVDATEIHGNRASELQVWNAKVLYETIY